MQRVRPMQEVKKIRDAIAVQKIESNTKNIAVVNFVKIMQFIIMWDLLNNII